MNNYLESYKKIGTLHDTTKPTLLPENEDINKNKMKRINYTYTEIKQNKKSRLCIPRGLAADFLPRRYPERGHTQAVFPRAFVERNPAFAFHLFYANGSRGKAWGVYLSDCNCGFNDCYYLTVIISAAV